MKLPEQLPTDPDELERLYNAYAQNVEDFNDAEFQRLMDARLAVWGIDPRQMSADQIFGAMSESMNSMLMNLYAAKDEAPDNESVLQVDEIIKMAEELRQQIAVAMRDAGVNNAGVNSAGGGTTGVTGDASADNNPAESPEDAPR